MPGRVWNMHGIAAFYTVFVVFNIISFQQKTHIISYWLYLYEWVLQYSPIVSLLDVNLLILDICFAWMSWTFIVICFLRLYIAVYCKKKWNRSVECEPVLTCQITLYGECFIELKTEKLLKRIMLLMNNV